MQQLPLSHETEICKKSSWTDPVHCNVGKYGFPCTAKVLRRAFLCCCESVLWNPSRKTRQAAAKRVRIHRVQATSSPTTLAVKRSNQGSFGAVCTICFPHPNENNEAAEFDVQRSCGNPLRSFIHIVRAGQRFDHSIRCVFVCEREQGNNSEGPSYSVFVAVLGQVGLGD